ncbi:probable GMP synthase [glutamine-hydrolyzing] [Triticum dicoccoides]|uniref:probable GMP synthase [glutamine-hydrolyzing] n=1 Tax=Triticum dicoccoides TaxID=85692 RepID=UPI001890953C|nr:probable GMP synthase [glutamine-hydrolyzing] [Triticum dicoccoides]
MPGVKSESLASGGLPELPRIRTTRPAASSKVVPRAKAQRQSSTKAKAGEDREKRRNSGSRGTCGESASSATCGTSPALVGPELEKRRCSWITANSEPVYVAFHDEEWGVPVHDDRKLFELLTLSQALAELSWPVILSKREEFRAMIDAFYNACVHDYTDKKINQFKSNGSTFLSEQKMRAMVANAKQIQKVVREFGSFSNYCWSFVNHRPITNGFRYARQVPTKTPKSEAMSKDLMRRGFRCVGPTTVYSFMQVAGIVNDHLLCCFRFDQVGGQPKAAVENGSRSARCS